MIERRVIQVGAVAWAGVGLAVGLLSLGSVNRDARLIVGIVTVLGPLAALLAATALGRCQDRLAGVLLVASVATPTYFAWLLNVPALIVGLALVIAPGRHPHAPARPPDLSDPPQPAGPATGLVTPPVQLSSELPTGAPERAGILGWWTVQDPTGDQPRRRSS